MRSKVIFRSRQEVQYRDLTDIEDFAAATFEDLTRDALYDGKAFSGFEVTQATTSEVTVAKGRFYNNGRMFYRDSSTTVPLASLLPLVTRKKVAIVVWGLQAEIDESPRDFVVDVETNVTEPQQVTMHMANTVQMQAIAGTENPDPQPPTTYDAAAIPVAYVTLATTGIIAIEPVVGNRMPNLKDVQTSVAALQLWKDQTDPRIATLTSEIAEIKRRLAGLGDQKDLFDIAADVARLKDIAGLPDDYADYGADRFLSADETDTTDPELLAKVEEGIRFSAEAENEQAIALFNPLDPNVKVNSSIIMPAYDHTRRVSVVDYISELSISQYGFQTIEMKQLTMSRERIRYGTEFTVCTNAAWFRSGQYDPITHIFRKDGETFEVLDNPDTFGGTAHFIRVRQYWRDWVEEPYWTAVTIDRSISGASVAQTFLNAQDGWLTRLSVWFTRLAASGNVTVAITETNSSGAPDPDRTICWVTVDYANLRLGWTTIDLPATFLKAGKKYGIRLITNADHWIGMASGNKYTHGTFFYTTDGSFFAGDLTRDMMFALDFAQFRASRVEVQLTPMSLSGGIAAIDIMTSMVTSTVATATFEVQIAGKWYSIDNVTRDLLIGLPPLLPMRVVFNGTTDVQAGILTTGSRVYYSRPRTSFKHISTPRLLSADTSTVRVRLQMEAWNSAHHAISCKLKIGGTLETPDTTETRDLGLDPNTGQATIVRTYVFNLDTPTDEFQIVTEGTTTTALDTYHVAERVDVES